MDVPFLSSSAINREHYNLIQNVETASTLHDVDDILLRKVGDVRTRFEKRAPTTSECYTSLILLLYCWTATTLGQITQEMLEFALPHAITLAEAGSNIKEKRLGYAFCTELMSESDELQLMLVNTLRKDLEDMRTASICLALDVLLLKLPVEAIPAISSRLVDILAHGSSHVRRKALTLVRNIGRSDAGILKNTREKVALRLKDDDSSVVDAALRLLSDLSRARVIQPREAADIILSNLTTIQNCLPNAPRILLVNVMGEIIKNLNATESDIDKTSEVLDEIFRMLETLIDSDRALILECFRAISNVPSELLKRKFMSKNNKGPRPLAIIARLLESHKPNIQFLCVSCLLGLDSSLWSGSEEGLPAAFNEDQVSMIMSLLGSQDSIIRIKTLQVLNRVDRSILLMHLTRLISTFSPKALHEEHRLAERALEASAIYETDGEAYAGRLREVCALIALHEGARSKRNSTNGGAQLVSENVVEQVLSHLNSSSKRFREEFMDGIIRIPASDAGPTLTLVIAATVCEYGALSTIPQQDLMRNLAERLKANPPAIQEALLLTMLRVTARHGSTLKEVSDEVRALHEISRSHIRKRCEQYLSLSDQMSILHRIVRRAKSDTLPDFLLALETADNHLQETSSTEDSRTSNILIERDNSRSPGTQSKLRYDAYEPPRRAPKLTGRRGSITSNDSHPRGIRLARSDSASSSSYSSPQSYARKEGQASRTGSDDDDNLARTLTAGDLAFAAHAVDLSGKSLSSPQITASRQPSTTPPVPVEDLISKSDLIALDSPFLVEPTASDMTVVGGGQQAALDFTQIWNALQDRQTTRGWSEHSVEALLLRFKAIPKYECKSLPTDIAPREGELQLVLSSRGQPGMTVATGLLAAVRLRPAEEGSTLWQMRCIDQAIKTEVMEIVGNL